ncbi:MAG: PmbA/TldA family metallopeptidase, partial [Actinomycetota bacterium]
MLDQEVIGRVLGEALGRGGDLAELFVEDRRSTALRLEEARVEDVASGSDSGAGIRVISGERASYAYTNLLTTDALLDAAKAARAGLAEGPVTPRDLRHTEARARDPVARPPEDVDAAEMAAALRAADEAARAAGAEVRQVIATYADVRQKV